MKILGIETSCDETAAAVVEDGRKVLSNVVLSQTRHHSRYGGVVPELAAREHLNAIEPVVAEALSAAGCGISNLDAVAVTSGPGLIPSLLVGLNFARGLAAAHGRPLIGINHFMAHIYGSFLEDKTSELGNPGTFPLVSLVVSGGHTAIVLAEAHGGARIVGTTLDDAAGEALDKAAKMLGLGYPGGPVIEKISRQGDPAKFAFPRSLTGAAGKALDKKDKFNFSFSGVKTSLYYHCRKYSGEDGSHISGQLLNDTVASYQEAVVDVLEKKTFAAAEAFRAKSVLLCGGVACNSLLRAKFADRAAGRYRLFIAEPRFCTDNAAMVAGMAARLLEMGKTDSLDIDAYSRLPAFEKMPFL